MRLNASELPFCFALPVELFRFQFAISPGRQTSLLFCAIASIVQRFDQNILRKIPRSMEMTFE